MCVVGSNMIFEKVVLLKLSIAVHIISVIKITGRQLFPWVLVIVLEALEPTDVLSWSVNEPKPTETQRY